MALRAAESLRAPIAAICDLSGEWILSPASDRLTVTFLNDARLRARLEHLAASSDGPHAFDAADLGFVDGAGHLPLPGSLSGFLAAPVPAGEDSPPGLLAVLDRPGRTWTSEDRGALADFAGIASELLKLQATLASGQRAQDALIHAQKMESLGVLAGGVSHDFNNLLTAILGFAGMVKRSPELSSDDRSSIESIEQAARRGADITGRLLAFSRGGLARFSPLDLVEVIAETIDLVEPTLPNAVLLDAEVPEAPVIVEGDRGQLVQALLNIVLNARDAMVDGGRISIRLEVGAEAVLTVTDNGTGMDAATRLRIFEPFFTTKPQGSGTGLGMAITYGIVQGHHGRILVESELGRGTSFTLNLPVMERPKVFDIQNAGEGDLILVVDDDAMVRRTTSATLAGFGYNVVEAESGSRAIEILDARPGRFSAVLLDLVMPGMAGVEAFRTLTRIRPDLPVIVVTGYAADAHIDDDMKRKISGLLQKPYAAERLHHALAAAGARPNRR